MAALPQHTSMSVEEYLQLERSSTEARYEYIDGYVTMLAGGTLDHATISLNVAGILRNLLRGSSCRVFSSDARVCLSETRYVYPDVTVSCDGRDRGRTDRIEYPRLVVEVLSPGTEGYDRGKKSAYYRKCPTIQEYVLIEAQSPSVEVFQREKSDLWTLRTFGMDDEITLGSLKVSFPLTAVYEDIVFSDDE